MTKMRISPAVMSIAAANILNGIAGYLHLVPFQVNLDG